MADARPERPRHTPFGPHLFWITSRAAGIATLLLSSMSLCIGLLMGGGALKPAHRGRSTGGT